MKSKELVEIGEPAILIRINRTYQASMNKDALYDYTLVGWDLQSHPHLLQGFVIRNNNKNLWIFNIVLQAKYIL